MSNESSSHPDKSHEGAILPQPATGAYLCESTARFADYWLKAARTAGAKEYAVMAAEQAINGWKNLAYDLARQAHYYLKTQAHYAESHVARFYCQAGGCDEQCENCAQEAPASVASTIGCVQCPECGNKIGSIADHESWCTAGKPNQSGVIDGVQFDKRDPATRLFIAANYWREKHDLLKASAASATPQKLTELQVVTAARDGYKQQAELSAGEVKRLTLNNWILEKRLADRLRLDGGS